MGTMRKTITQWLAPLALAALLAGCCQTDAPVAPSASGASAHVSEPRQASDAVSEQPLLGEAVVTEEPAVADETAGAPAGAITDAIRALEPVNPEHWTKAGKPRVKALEERLGHDISAADRDAAWQEIEDIRAAIRALTLDNPEHWTKAGKPRVRALEEHLGHDITAADRDFAWKTVQAEQ